MNYWLEMTDENTGTWISGEEKKEISKSKDSKPGVYEQFVPKKDFDELLNCHENVAISKEILKETILMVLGSLVEITNSPTEKATKQRAKKLLEKLHRSIL